MKTRAWIVGALLLGLLGATQAQAAPVEELQRADRYTFETDPDNATKYPVMKCTNCTGGNGTVVDGIDTNIKATVKDYVNSNPLAIIPVDTNGDPASLSGGTQYDQGTAATDTDKLTMMGCVRADSAAVATGVAALDRARCIIDATNRLWTHVGTIDGGTITSITNPVTVTDGAGALNVICDSGCGSGTQYIEDVAETNGSSLSMAGSVRRDTAASSAGTDGDNATINTDATGRLWVRPTGGVTPADNFAIPTDAITVWALNGCYDGATYDMCVKGTAGAGAVDANTARTTEATDSQLSTDVAAIKTAVQLIDDDQTGTSNNHRLSVGTTEDETEIKGSAGRLMAVQVSNVAATVAYLRCANQVAASTTPGTTAIFWGMAVPGNTTGAGLTAVIGGASGLAFSTGLTCWVVTGKAATDVTEVGANDVEWNIQYK